jgi:tRNA nucleotidyltransferase (CCA-adding enzyme)
VNTVDSIISEALKQVQPSIEDVKKLTEIANETMKHVNQNINSSVVEVIIGGSFAKGTWIKEDVDIDIFVKFDTSIDDRQFRQFGELIGWESLKAFDPYVRFSDHPYVEAVIDGVRVNVVPCYDVPIGKWKSAADRSPFHTKYMNDHLDDDKKCQVRLLKKFLKSTGAYGADISTGGFSGYVAEIMTLKYGSLEQVLNVMSVMGPNENVISVYDYDDNNFIFSSPLIIIDPIDQKRNLGAAISAATLGKFIICARSFLAKPSTDFFCKQQKTFFPNYELHNRNLLVLSFRYEKRSPDVLRGQLKKSSIAISKQLELAAFKVFRTTCVTDEKGSAAFGFLLESINLSKYTQKIGPKVLMKKETDNFVAGNQKDSLISWVDSEMRVRIAMRRRVTNAKQYLKYLLTRNIDRIGITKGLIEDVRKSFHLHSGDDLNTSGIVMEAVTDLLTSDQGLS